MTSPHVIELPRRLEPVVRDTFLGVVEGDTLRVEPAVGIVVALRPRAARDLGGRDRQPTPPAAA